jgi:Fe-S-cluster containining protein
MLTALPAPSWRFGGATIVSDPIRECGSCSACCTVLGVHEIEKGTYEACQHLSEAGCGIYADRPGSCRTFECQWLRGMLEVDGTIDTDLRPDSCGVIFEYQPGTAFGEVFKAWEVEPGASARGQARKIIRGLEEASLVIIMACGPRGEGVFGGCSLVGPPHLVMQASDVMWSRPADLGIEG